MDRSERTPNPKRITLNSLKDWVNAQLKRFYISEYECFKVERTRFNADQYEGGAAKLYVRIKRKDTEYHPVLNDCTILCFFSIYEIKDHLKAGWNLALKQSYRRQFEHLISLNQLELDLTK